MPIKNRNQLVIGVGNEHRGDDAIGLCVVRMIKDMNPPATDILEVTGEASQLLDRWNGYINVVIVDAVLSHETAGTIHVWKHPGDSFPTDLFTTSTHSIGVAQAIELAQTLNQLPGKLTVYGIVGKQFEMGSTLSLPARQIKDIAQYIVQDMMERD